MVASECPMMLMYFISWSETVSTPMNDWQPINQRLECKAVSLFCCFWKVCPPMKEKPQVFWSPHSWNRTINREIWGIYPYSAPPFLHDCPITTAMAYGPKPPWEFRGIIQAGNGYVCIYIYRGWGCRVEPPLNIIKPAHFSLKQQEPKRIKKRITKQNAWVWGMFSYKTCILVSFFFIG